MSLNNFNYAYSLLNTMYGLEMDEDDFAEVGILAWQLIGNKNTKLYRYSTCVNSCEEGVELPCNVDMIEAVTAGFEEWAHSTNDTPEGDIHSAYTEAYIESRKGFRHPLYQPGKFIKYERVGDTLYFDRPHGKVNILYRGIILDDDDLPEITDKEAMAIATYVAYVEKYKEGIQTNNANIIQMAELLYQKWNQQCDQARVDHYMSQNDWDQVLDAKTSWCRKQHNRSFKIFN